MHDFTYEGASPQKRDVALDEAQEVWLDPCRIEFAVRTDDEPRHFTIGKVRNGSHVTVAYFSLASEKVRLLSARKSLTEEIELYESERS